LSRKENTMNKYQAQLDALDATLESDDTTGQLLKLALGIGFEYFDPAECLMNEANQLIEAAEFIASADGGELFIRQVIEAAHRRSAAAMHLVETRRRAAGGKFALDEAAE